jgi:hypothetical protein
MNRTTGTNRTVVSNPIIYSCCNVQLKEIANNPPRFIAKAPGTPGTPKHLEHPKHLELKTTELW